MALFSMRWRSSNGSARFAVGSGVALSVAIASCARMQPVSAPSPLMAYDGQARALLARMTLAEKVGQMTQADHEFIRDPGDVGRYFLGSVLNGGNSDPREGNSLGAWRAMYESYQQHAVHTRLRIPLIYGVDAVHGNNNVLGAVIFPHNIGLGATRDSALVRRIGEITAEETRAVGVNWAFAPCVCVPQDIRWGRTYEGYSEDPAIVSSLGAAAVLGLQGSSLRDPLRVAATAKHFLGDGGTSPGTGTNKWGLDQGDTRVDSMTLRAIHLHAYRAAVAAGAASIMPSYNSWNGTKVSGNKHLLTDVLKGELGFTGFLISDYRAVDQVDPDYKTAIATSVNAGMDMVMVPDRYRDFITLLTANVNEGRVPMARIDDAVLRILRVKFAMGMMDPGYEFRADRGLEQRFGSPEHRAVARQAVRESLVLLKNDGATLPLSKSLRRIHVAGKNADDVGNQSGGWTIDWQGKSGAVTTGTTILAGIRHAVGAGTQVTYSADASGAAGADVVVVVVGETPYAEMLGDRLDLALDSTDRRTVATARATNAHVVVVVVSGRPLILGPVVNQADAIVAAWLPGSEGDGVADVLFGDYQPTGKLSYTWPRAMEQVPRSAASAQGALFRIGFGLGYRARQR